MTSPLISLVTVNHNGRELLRPFLESVRALEVSDGLLELIVVDNGSTDGSVEFVLRRFPSARVLENTDNIGFARANNQAADIARGRYLALANNDMRLHPRWVAALLDYLERAPSDLRCAGSLILNWDGSQVDFGGATLAFNGVGFQVHAGEPFTGRNRHDFPDEILFPCGGAMMIERDLFLDSGGFDADYFAYLEDVDLGWRLWLLGERVGFCPDAVAYHLHNGTAGRFAMHRRVVLRERNALATLVKNYDDATLAAVLPAALLLAIKRSALLSGFPREEFAIVPKSGQDAPAAPEPPRLSLRAKIALLVRSYGPLGAAAWLLKRALGPIAPGVAARLTPAPRLVPPAGRTFPHEAYATLVALEDLVDQLPALFEKRRRVQSARRRSDEELFALFGTPFRPPDLPEKLRIAYAEAQESLVDAFGLAAYFEAVPEPAGAAAPV